MKRKVPKNIAILFIALGIAFPVSSIIPIAEATPLGGGASLSLSFTPQELVVGDIFDVSVFLDTGGNSINAVDINLKFSSDKLQVISPSVGKSIIGIWTAQPSFNNSTGEIRFQGGIPTPGINTSRGLISTISFRVKSVGSARLTFSGNSKVFQNDGLGTNVLTETRGASYALSLPEPEGPNVTSFTHPEQSKWYRNSTVGLEWTNSFPADGYSYSLSHKTIEDPDNISEGKNTGVSYKNLTDGLYYLHIKALRNNIWGGTTHYAVKIDASEPAEFKINIPTGDRTSIKVPVIDFQTTDAISGINRYELKIVPINIGKINIASGNNSGSFFIEVPTRYIADSELALGKYDIIVRAYDNSGNFRESTKRLTIVNPIFSYNSSNITIFGKFLIPWFIIIILLAISLVGIIIILRLALKYHKDAHAAKISGVLQDPIIKQRLEELEKRKKKHFDLRKSHAGILLALILAAGLLGPVANAQEGAQIPPPIIGTVSTSISDDQLFYISGRSDVADSEVIVYIQNLQDNQLITGTVDTDKKGDWFYAHESPLIKGNYSVWTQQKIGSQFSPPSPQRKVSVNNTAIQIGASRLSSETMYLFAAIILFIISLGLASLSTYHFYNGRRKRKDIQREIKELENAIRNGFITLQRDIKEEIAIVGQARISKTFTKAHEEKEKTLLKDLEDVEEYIKKEFKDVKIHSKSIRF